MKSFLIVNADDYGITAEISRGIRIAHQQGIVTSTTVMIGMAGAPEAIIVAQRETPALGMGLHLTLAGKAVPPVLPPEQIPSLVRADGLFYDEPEWSDHITQFKSDQIEAELRAQFDRFVATAKALPTHLDSHYHAAYRSPAALQAVYALATEHHLPIRHPGFTPLSNAVRYPNHFIGVKHTMSASDLIDLILSSTNHTTVELMCHPGYADDLLPMLDTMTVERESELALLIDPSVRVAIEAAEIKLVSFNVL